MNNSTPNQNPVSRSTDTPQTVLRCLTGALIAGGLTIALYFLTSSIAQTFAAKALPSTSTFAINIAVAVRTLVVGMSALGTGVFGLVTIGLVALSGQILVQRFVHR
ncbi:MAG: DUF3082 domain-containing protein [Chamaesiphon sp.]